MGEKALADLALPGGLISGPFGSNLVSKDYVLEGVPIIRGINLTSGCEVVGEYAYVTPEKCERDLSRSIVVPGDLVFTQRGTLGQVAMVPSGSHPKYVVSQSQMGLRVDPALADARFVYYACTSAAFNAQISDNSIATGVPHINLGILRRLTVPDFSIMVQSAIATVLGALDEKIAANDRVAKAALELGDQLFLRDAARNSRTATTIGELADRVAIEFSDGYRTKKSEHGQPGLRILRAGDVRDSYVYPAGQDYVSLDYSRQIGAKVSKPGDVVLTTKGTVGRVAVVADAVEQVVYSPQVCFFRVKDDTQVDRDYLGAWFRGNDLQRQAATLMYKSDMAPYISLRDIRSLVIPLQSIEEQRRQGKVQRDLRAAFEASRVENERLARTRDELLPLLMSRKVRVKDAEAVAGEVL